LLLDYDIFSKIFIDSLIEDEPSVRNIITGIYSSSVSLKHCSASLNATVKSVPPLLKSILTLSLIDAARERVLALSLKIIIDAVLSSSY